MDGCATDPSIILSRQLAMLYTCIIRGDLGRLQAAMFCTHTSMVSAWHLKVSRHRSHAVST